MKARELMAQQEQTVEADTRYHLMRDRSLVPERFKWRLQDIYPSYEEWKVRRERMVQEFGEITAYRGRLASGAGILRECLDRVSELNKEYVRLYCYASMHSDLDTREARYTWSRK